jgi:hypothetical protein
MGRKRSKISKTNGFQKGNKPWNKGIDLEFDNNLEIEKCKRLEHNVYNSPYTPYLYEDLDVQTQKEGNSLQLQESLTWAEEFFQPHANHQHCELTEHHSNFHEHTSYKHYALTFYTFRVYVCI